MHKVKHDGACKKNLLRNRRAASVVVASVILSATVLTLGFIVLYWAQFESAKMNADYARNISEGIDLLNEKMVLIHTHYNNTTEELSVYLMNSGNGSRIIIDKAILGNGSWSQSFDVELKAFDGTQINGLYAKEEGYFILKELIFQENSLYNLKIITRKGGVFSQTIGI